MSTNWGDAFVEAMRTTLNGVAGLPSARAWANRTDDPAPPFLDDTIVTFDTQWRESGPDGWKRVTAVYRVGVYVGTGRDVHLSALYAAAIESAYMSATITIKGEPAELLGTRIGPPSPGDALYVVRPGVAAPQRTTPQTGFNPGGQFQARYRHG